MILGCARRGDSFSVNPQKAEHRLNELQRWEQTVAISSVSRDGREMLMLLLQPPRILCASTGHYPQPCPESLCSPPLPGSCNPGTTSLGEHTVHLRLLQLHMGLWTAGSPRILIMTTVPFPPPDMSDPEPPNQLLI